MLHHSDELRLGMTTEHEATTGWGLSPEVDQRRRGDRSGAEQKRAKPSPGRCEGQCGEGQGGSERGGRAERRREGDADRARRTAAAPENDGERGCVGGL